MLALFRTTLVGGVLFLLPLVIVLLLVGKALQVSLMFADPIASTLQVEGLGAVLLVELAAVLVLVALCYLAGLVATRVAVQQRFAVWDGRLMDMLPPYAVAKAMVAAMARAEGEADQLRPVLVRFDDYEQLAFEVERSDDRVVLFLPGAPNPWSGTSVIVEAARVQPLGTNSHDMVRSLRLLGRGSLATTTQ